MKCITNVKHQTGCGRRRWGKSERKSGKTEGGREGDRGCCGASHHRVDVCVRECVRVCVGRAQWGGWGHGGRDQSIGASSTGNRDDGERMEEACGGKGDRVKGRDVVSLEFENSAGRDGK